ncbi:putative ribosomal protein S17/S11 [Dioscorea sansibarensis]
MILTSPFIHGALPSLRLPKLQHFSSSPPPSISIAIKAMKTVQGRVVCATNDKTVAVEVVRLAPHPKYKRRVRKKKIFQAHDADNRFRVGDFVQLEKSRPISKTKSFIALPVTAKNVPKAPESIPEELLGIPLQSQQQE